MIEMLQKGLGLQAEQEYRRDAASALQSGMSGKRSFWKDVKVLFYMCSSLVVSPTKSSEKYLFLFNDVILKMLFTCHKSVNIFPLIGLLRHYL